MVISMVGSPAVGEEVAVGVAGDGNEVEMLEGARYYHVWASVPATR